MMIYQNANDPNARRFALLEDDEWMTTFTIYDEATREAVVLEGRELSGLPPDIAQAMAEWLAGPPYEDEGPADDEQVH